MIWTAALNLLVRAVPGHLIAYYPFRDRLRFSWWKAAVPVTALQIVQALLYGRDIAMGGSGKTAEFAFALAYISFYFFSVRDDRSKLLFLYIFSTDYIIMLRGFSSFLEACLFYSPDMSFSSLRSTCMSLAVLAVSAPFMLRFLTRAREQVFSTDAPLFWRTAWMVPAFTTVIVMIFTRNLDPGEVRLFRFLFVRVLLLLCTFVVYSTLISALAGIREQAALREQTAVQEHLLYLQQMQHKQIVKYITDTRTARHDLRQHLNILRAYVEKKDLEGLRTYLDAYEETLPANIRKVFTRNFALNAVFTYYGEEARRHGIDYDVTAMLPESLPVREPEVCALLGNLLENAIEACKNTSRPRPFIRARGMCGENYIVLTVDNSCEKEPVRENGRFLSTRHPGYGTGTYSVQMTAEQSGGTAEFSCADGVFYASVMLCGGSSGGNGTVARPRGGGEEFP